MDGALMEGMSITKEEKRDILIREFMASDDYSEKTHKTVLWLLNEIESIGYTADDLLNCDIERLESVIIDLKPNSIRAISTYAYCMKILVYWYVKGGFGGCREDILNVYESLDRQSVWKKARPWVTGKLISHETYLKFLEDISNGEEYNTLYYECLVRSIYEGIYNNNHVALRKLRACDILYDEADIQDEKGNIFTLNISRDLASDLIKLSKEDIWYKVNGNNKVCRIKLSGAYEDSVFRTEIRRNSTKGEEGRKFMYYRLLRQRSEEYLGFQLHPRDLYISGIMHRISIAMAAEGIPMKVAFAEYNKDPKVNKIIREELCGSNYEISVHNFRYAVNGYVDLFCN